MRKAGFTTVTHCKASNTYQFAQYKVNIKAEKHFTPVDTPLKRATRKLENFF